MKTDQDLAISNRFEFQGISQGQEKKNKENIEQGNNEIQKTNRFGLSKNNKFQIFFFMKENKNKDTNRLGNNNKHI